LSQSKYVDDAVFKGGASLSKGYGLIERFSEDVDLAIINSGDKSGNEIKTIIRNVEKTITAELTEVPTEGITSKGSKFRKSVYKYPTAEKDNASNALIVEINSFANPYPFQPLRIKSFVFDFLMQTGNEKYIEQYDLHPFVMNVLSKEQTLLEKLVSLLRISFDAEPVIGISEKIRHFYDLYFLMNHPECAEFVALDSFKKQFDWLLQHDKGMFDEPEGWQSFSITESPLISNFPTIWMQLKEKYQTELSAFAYRPIPDEESVAKCFAQLIKRIE
jgi:predicted nucleotidyltransferase component of viral defense system